MEGKKIATSAILIAIAIVAVAFAVKRITGGPKPPTWVLDEQVQKIDTKSLELVKEPVRDWEGKYAPDASGRCKNPKTGEYTLVDPMTCGVCGQLIPAMQIPPNLQDDARIAFIMKFQRDYKCPRCGKNPYTLP